MSLRSRFSVFFGILLAVLLLSMALPSPSQAEAEAGGEQLSSRQEERAWSASFSEWWHRIWVRLRSVFERDSESVSALAGTYLALGHAEQERSFSRASFLAERLSESLSEQNFSERSMIVHVRAGNFPPALAIAEELKQQTDGYGFLARFLLATQAMKDKRYTHARSVLGDLAGFGDFARLGAPVYRFWIGFALDDRRMENVAAQDLERESQEDFAQLMRLYAFLAVGQDWHGVRQEQPSFVWAHALLLAQRDREDEAVRLIERTRDVLQVRSMYLAELSAAIVEDRWREFLPQKDRASFFLARALADLSARQVLREPKLVLARLASLCDPHSDYVRLVLALALSEYRRYDESLSVVSALTPRSPFYWQALIHKARWQDQQGDVEEAAASFAELHEHRPNRIAGWWHSGSFYRFAEQHEKAIGDFDRTLEFYKGKPLLSDLWQVFYERGIAHERSGDWDKAEADFLQALALSPEQPMVLNYLAYSWLDLERKQHYRTALAMLKRAAAQRQSSGAVVDSLGWAYYRLKDYRRALTHLERAISLSPQDPTINDHLGDVYWRVGREFEARYQWQRVFVLDADDSMRKHVQQKLDIGLPYE